MKIVGITDEHSGFCDCCGTAIKVAVALRNNEGDVVLYGRTCAALSLGRKVKFVEREARTVQAEYDRTLPATRLSADRDEVVRALLHAAQAAIAAGDRQAVRIALASSVRPFIERGWEPLDGRARRYWQEYLGIAA